MMEDTRRKSSLTVPSNLPPLPSSTTQLQRHSSLSEAERTYIFTTNVPEVQSSGIKIGSGHLRSVSHGGGAMQNPGSGGAIRPLKSAMKGGHQRALSQGTIQDAPPRSGHSRVGSKTDFILPPTHKEPDETREPVTAVVSARGHARQASRSESVYTLRRQDLPSWWKRFLFCRSSKFEEYGFRNVVPNHTVPAKTQKRDHPNGKFMGNKIRTTKYTMLTFLPKNLIEQFHRVANLYFVFIQFLNWVPELNVFGKEIAMIPLLIVLGVTAIKDLIEDRRRYASDKRINNSTCRVYHGETDRYVKIRWQDLRVGDIVHLSNNEIIPADILLLKSSEPQSICYIETCDLDGETNLKRRQVVRGFDERQSSFTAGKFISKLEIDAPTTKIYRFHGAMIHNSGERVPISSDNLLLRESRLKNTGVVEGIVVYAGHETKAMLNNSGPRYKRSYLEQKMNIDVVWCVIILILLCAVGAIGCFLWLSKFKGEIPFLTTADMINPGYESVLMFFRLVIILQILIPLALYVTIEMCKVIQVLIIHNSPELYDPHTNKKTECRAMNITENLGQIQYIFSDKTGTLTENRMAFRRCTIAGVDYNHPQSEDEKISSLHAPLPPVVPNTNLQLDLSHCDTNGRPSLHAQRCKEFFTVLALCNTVVVSESPHRDNMNASGLVENGDDQSVTLVKPSDPLMNDHYLRLPESHSVSPSLTPNNSNNKLQPPNSLKMQHVPSLSPISSSAESSPESDSPPMRIKSITPTGRVKKTIINQVSKLPIVPQMLVSTGKSIKKFHISSKHKLLQMSTNKHQKTVTTNQYEAESPDELALVNSAFAYGFVLENRNPNTVIISEPNEGIVEYEILKVLPFDSIRKCMSIVVRKIGGHDVMLYTKGADSTILPALAQCAVESEEYRLREKTQHQLDLYARQGLRVLLIAKRNLNPVEFSEWYSENQECEMSTEGREKKIRESFGLLERNLTLIGSTGIEDRLQEDVPETIAGLLSAGIVVWVLTGDKTETAINIAYSAKLFHSQMEILKLTARSKGAAESAIKFYMDEIEKQLVEAGDDAKYLRNRALVVDGKTLTFILDLKSNLTPPFLELTRYCSSVLCCRSTPLQKAYLVKVVKEELKMSTLAIGDGANDVSMLQMADVGVGICGQEGMQAVMASDFATPKFKFLEKLLLIHGHLNYDRLAKLIIYFFYKNATFVFVLFWFQLYCGFSGSVMMEQMYVMIYNFMFTAAPPLAIGTFEKRLHEDILIKNPRLYRYGRLGKGYRNQFWLVMLDSLWQSLVIFFIAVKAFEDSTIGIWEFGATIVSSCLVTMLCHFALEVRTWTIIHVGAIILSLLSFYIFAFVYNTICRTCMDLPNTARTIQDTMSNPIYYLILLLTPVMALLPRYFVRTIKNTIRPSDDVLIQIETEKERKRGEKLLTSYRSASSRSPIFRITNNQDETLKTIS